MLNQCLLKWSPAGILTVFNGFLEIVMQRQQPILECLPLSCSPNTTCVRTTKQHKPESTVTNKASLRPVYDNLALMHSGRGGGCMVVGLVLTGWRSWWKSTDSSCHTSQWWTGTGSGSNGVCRLRWNSDKFGLCVCLVQKQKRFRRLYCCNYEVSETLWFCIPYSLSGFQRWYSLYTLWMRRCMSAGESTSLLQCGGHACW